jgi:hypothetical protein
MAGVERGTEGGAAVLEDAAAVQAAMRERLREKRVEPSLP